MKDLIIKTKFSKEQLDSFEIMKQDEGWLVLMGRVEDAIKDCDINDVDIDKLSAEDYKIECKARKKAKEMFMQLFDEIIETKKINYG